MREYIQGASSPSGQESLVVSSVQQCRSGQQCSTFVNRQSCLVWRSDWEARERSMIFENIKIQLLPHQWSRGSVAVVNWSSRSVVYCQLEIFGEVAQGWLVASQ